MAQVVTNPGADPGLTAEIAQGLLRVEEWKTQRPLTALTQNVLDFGSLFLGPEAAAGRAAKAGRFGEIAQVADVAEGTRLTAALDKVEEATRSAGTLDHIAGSTADLTKNLDKMPSVPAGDKPPALAAPEKTPASPLGDKPPATPSPDKTPPGGKPVSPNTPTDLPTSPVESKPATPAAGAGTADSALTPKPSATDTDTDTAATVTSEHAVATPTTPPQSEVLTHAGTGSHQSEAFAHGNAGTEAVEARIEHMNGPVDAAEHPVGSAGESVDQAQFGGQPVAHGSSSVQDPVGSEPANRVSGPSSGGSDSVAAVELDNSQVVAEPLSTPRLVPGEGVDFGLTPANAFEVLTNPVDDIARLRDAGIPEHVLEGYDPLAGRTIEQFMQEFTVRGHGEKLQWDWAGQAPNDGFAGPPSVADRIPYGKELDRLGSELGGFMASDGSPLSSRGMPPGVASAYNRYFGTGVSVPVELPWEVRYGPAKEAFGQPGGAEQWVVIDVETQRSVSLDLLLRKGIVRAR
jgi:hypothetical protein